MLRQAWDATKLVGVILDKKKERALVLAEETKSSVVVYRGQNATKKVNDQIFEFKLDSQRILALADERSV